MNDMPGPARATPRTRPRRRAVLVAVAVLALSLGACGDYLEGPGAGGFHACARENAERMGSEDAAQWCADFDGESW
jgi:hypothetical protein